MPDLLSVHAGLTPDKVAVVEDAPGRNPRRFTMAEMNAYANRIANGLLHLGVRPGERVVWCGRNSAEVVAILHACRKAGFGSVPLNYRLTDDESAYVVDDADAVVVLADADHAAMFHRIRPQLPKVRDVVIFGGATATGTGEADVDQRTLAEVVAGASADDPPEPSGPAGEQVIYTSGTTGRPKGAVRDSMGSPQQTAGLLALLGCSGDDVHLTTGPLYHSGPLAFATVAFVLGCPLVVQRQFDAEDWLRLVETYRVTATFSAPTPVRMICNLPDAVRARYDVSSMRLMAANAAPWPFALKQQYLSYFPETSLYEIYGATELGIITVLEPADQLRKPGSCGRPAPLVEVALFDDDGRAVTEPGAPGELFVRAQSVFRTYHKAHDKFLSEHRAGDWHTVGDVAYRDDEGYLYICDRKKDMVISGGMNIYPAEIEAALELDPRIFEAAVIGLPSEEWGETVHAVVVPVEGASLTLADVQAVARQHLAGYKVPRSASFVDELPKTGSGKIVKRELRERFAAAGEAPQ